MRPAYSAFLHAKSQAGGMSGFDPIAMPDFLFDFQQSLVDWSLRKGRNAIFADCGLGKTPMQLVWADNVVRHANKPVLILTPPAVALQTIAEGAKFGIEVHNARDGTIRNGINVVNYERLHHFDRHAFAGVVCDESSILKSFDGTRRQQITDFMRHTPYRLLCTATAAPNDYIELGTSAEAVGELGYTDMLTRFFKNDQNTIRPTVYRHHGQNFQALDEGAKWRFKGHAEQPFWRWVCSWARACRKPSDLGFHDGRFILPPLIEQDYLVESRTQAEGMLFSLPAVGLAEQREERRRTITERCEKIAELVNATGEPALVWCHLNDEGDLLERLIPGCRQVSGKDSDDAKEDKLMGFQRNEYRVMVTKPKIGAWGMNYQHCAHVTFFPSHSYEQLYQGVRRCWRFGQTRPVKVDIVTTEGEKEVLKNLQRKSVAADRMFARLVANMNESQAIDRGVSYTKQETLPSWL